MKVQTALLARYAEVEQQGGLLNVTGGGIDVFGVSRLPADFPIAFVLQLSFDDAEADQPHRRDGTRPGSAAGRLAHHGPVHSDVRRVHAEGWRGIFSIAGTLELSIEQFGPHSVQIDIDGKQAGDIPFRAGHADA